jgi:DNA-binding transcriptional ArsR family regulator
LCNCAIRASVEAMTRRPASERFDDLHPPEAWPPRGDELGAAIAALVHPARRALLDCLVTTGPSPVGRLARETGLAPGSVSHHIRVLAKAGFVVAAPELAGDTRESWWRTVPRSLSWDDDAFGAGPSGARLVETASDANLGYLLDAVRRWRGGRAIPGWDAQVNDTLVMATAEQLGDLGQRLGGLLGQWASECRADPAESDGEERRAVRVVALAFPEVARRG